MLKILQCIEIVIVASDPVHELVSCLICALRIGVSGSAWLDPEVHVLGKLHHPMVDSLRSCVRVHDRSHIVKKYSLRHASKEMECIDKAPQHYRLLLGQRQLDIAIS